MGIFTAVAVVALPGIAGAQVKDTPQEQAPGKMEFANEVQRDVLPSLRAVAVPPTNHLRVRENETHYTNGLANNIRKKPFRV